MVFEEEDFTKAVKDFEDPDLKDWEFFVESHGVKIYRFYRKQSKLYEYKVIGEINIKAELCVAVYMDLAYRRQWDGYVKELTCLRKSDPEIIYWEVAYPWPMSHRDYVYQRQLKEMSSKDRRIWVILSRSAKPDELPEGQAIDEKKGVIRVDDYLQSLVILDAGQNTSQIFMHYYDDPKGMIPTMIVNWAAKTGVPAFLTNMEDACKKYSKSIPT